jgi:rhodanese-related sulfurtransferase
MLCEASSLRMIMLSPPGDLVKCCYVSVYNAAINHARFYIQNTITISFPMQHITPSQLKEWIAAGKAFRLVDVREDFEHAEFNIGGVLLPLGSVIQQQAQIEREIPVVIYCKKGVRSQIAIQRLSGKFGFTNLINLTGGMERWKREMG